MPEKTHDEQARIYTARNRKEKTRFGRWHTEQLAQDREDDRQKGKHDFTVAQTKVEFSRRGKLKVVLYPRTVADAKPSRYFSGKGGKAVHLDPKGYVPPAPRPVPVVYPAKDPTPASKAKPFQGETAEELKEYGEATKGTWNPSWKPVRRVSDAPRDFARYQRDRSCLVAYAAFLRKPDRFGNYDIDLAREIESVASSYESWGTVRRDDPHTFKLWVRSGRTILIGRGLVFRKKLQEPVMKSAGRVDILSMANDHAAKFGKRGSKEYKKAFHAKFTELKARQRSRKASDEVQQRFGKR